MKLELTDDLVLVEPLSRPRITSAGIEIPEGAAQAEPRYGEVIEVGPGRLIEGIVPSSILRKSKSADSGERIKYYPKRYPMSVKAGDRVFYNLLNVHPVMYNGKGHFLVREHAIFAVITEDEFRYETIVSKQSSRVECPEHGSSVPKCTLMEAVQDGRRGVYCPTSKKFYGEKDLKGE